MYVIAHIICNQPVLYTLLYGTYQQSRTFLSCYYEHDKLSTADKTIGSDPHNQWDSRLDEASSVGKSQRPPWNNMIVLHHIPPKPLCNTILPSNNDHSYWQTDETFVLIKCQSSLQESWNSLSTNQKLWEFKYFAGRVGFVYLLITHCTLSVFVDKEQRVCTGTEQAYSEISRQCNAFYTAYFTSDWSVGYLTTTIQLRSSYSTEW
jgi:hypothetical protein